MSIAYQSDQGVATIDDRPPGKEKCDHGRHVRRARRQPGAGGRRRQAVRAVLVTGAGAAFTAGNDLKDFSESEVRAGGFAGAQLHAGARRIRKARRRRSQRLAVGIGVTMLLHCDLVYVADNATLLDAVHEPRPCAGVRLDAADAADRRPGARRGKAPARKPFPAQKPSSWARQCRCCQRRAPAACAKVARMFNEPAARRRPRHRRSCCARRRRGRCRRRSCARLRIRASARGREAREAIAAILEKRPPDFYEVRVGRWPCSSARPRPAQQPGTTTRRNTSVSSRPSGTATGSALAGWTTCANSGDFIVEKSA